MADTIVDKMAGIKNLWIWLKVDATPALLTFRFIPAGNSEQINPTTNPTIKGTQGLKQMSASIAKAMAP